MSSHSSRFCFQHALLFCHFPFGFQGLSHICALLHQKDQDSLPAYDVLDAILYAYIEEDQSQDDIIAKGFDKDVVEKVILLVDRNEHKRRQGAIGPRITSRAFSRERRYPIVNGWKAGV